MRIEWKTCFRIGLSIFLLYLCIRYWTVVAEYLLLFAGAAMPLLIGCMIAYVVNILMSFYERKIFVKAGNKILLKRRRPLCLMLAYLTLLAVLVLVMWLIVPQLVSCAKVILAKLPDVLKNFMSWVKDTGVLPENIAASIGEVDWKSTIGQIAQVLTSGIGSVFDVVVAAVSSVFSGVVSVFLGIIFSIYLLSGKEKLGRQLHRVARRYLKKSWNKKIHYVLHTLNDCFHKYIVGQCTEAVILGALCTIGMLILQLPYATMIGAFIAFTALIPVAGAYIGAIVGAFMIFTESPFKAIVFLIFIIVLQQFEGNIIYPRVVGSSMGLPAMWVLAAVTVGGGVMGIPGMLLGVPLAAALYRFVREDVNRGTRRP